MPYDPVTEERLHLFLIRLGREVQTPGRVYLVGGTSLLYQRLKAATKDVDIASQIPPAARDDFSRALHTLSQALNMAIEEVSPADFIPVPRGAADRHLYLGRQGELEIFAFDPISTALAKIARGRLGDINDVLALLDAGQVHSETLRAAFAEILPRVAAGEALKITAEQYQEKMTAFLELVERHAIPPTPGPDDTNAI